MTSGLARKRRFLENVPMPSFLALLRCALLGLALLAGTAPAAPLAMRELAAIPDHDRPALSPDGRFLAVLVPIDGRVNLGVLDLDTRRIVNRVAIPGLDIRDARWIGDDWLVFSTDRYGAAGAMRLNTGGLYAVSRDGSRQIQLFPSLREAINAGMRRRFAPAAPLRDVPGRPGEMIVAVDDGNGDEVDVNLYRQDLATGRRTLLTRQRPPRTFHWLLDHDLVPRVALAGVADRSDIVVHYRAGADAPWRELWRSSRTAGTMTLPLHFDTDNRGLYVASNEGRDTMAVHLVVPDELGPGAPVVPAGATPLAEHPRFDIGADASGRYIGGLLLDHAGRDVVGYRFNAEKPVVLWADDGHRRLQELVDRALPDTVNLLQRSAGRRTLVASFSDVRAERWHLLDEKDGTLSPLFVSRPWLDRRMLPAMTPFWFRTRDGMEILSYLFLPPDRAADAKLPTVIEVHGGPWLRPDSWGEPGGGVVHAQWLASRGYAVILANFRGTTGLGRRLYQASRGQFGLAMQDDVEDLADWAVREGVADAGRICLMGASYGGYATLMGLAKTPAKYRCGVAGAPASDLEKLLVSGWSAISRLDAPRRYWTEMVGDPAVDGAALRAVSPARLAERIRAPVMIYAGADDSIAPVEQAEAMRAALRAAGREPRWVMRYGEGHGFRSTANVLDLHEQIADFLQTHLGTPDKAAQ